MRVRSCLSTLVLAVATAGAAWGQPPPLPPGVEPGPGPVPVPDAGPVPGPFPPPMPPPPYDYGFEPPPPVPLRDFSWVYIDAPRPREIKVHDIITIIVDEKSETTVNSRFNRQRMANLKAELKEFMRIGKGGRLTNAAEDSPTIDTNLLGRLQTTGQALDQEGVRYRIAATVVDVLPNGNVVLEARKSIRTSHDAWEYSLTGIIASTNINRDMTALSENIANLQIVKRQSGKVNDSTKRPWGVRLYDLLSPF